MAPPARPPSERCVRCLAEFFFLFKLRYRCYACRYDVCGNCCTYSKKLEAHVCHACLKQQCASPLLLILFVFY